MRLAQADLHKFYENEVVHFAVPGMTNFIGRIASGPNPRGDGWIRVEHPVIIMEASQAGKQGFMMSTLAGPYQHYRQYVDFFIPPDKAVEIRTLDPEGNLYKMYLKEVNAPKRERIIAPHEVDSMPPLPKQ